MTTRHRRVWPSFMVVALLVALGVALAPAVLTSVTAVSAAVPGSQSEDDAPERDIDERAEQLLRAMSDVLAGARNIRFRAESTEDIVDEATGRVVHYVTRQTISMARPNRLRVDVVDSFSRHDSWFDDGLLTVYDSMRGQYTTIRAPGHVDSLLDTLHDEHELVIPLADLVVSDPFAAFIDNVRTGDYLGETVIAGRTCHHLALRQENLDWQVWIAADEPAVPVMLVITYTADVGHPQFSSRFEDWDLTASFEPDYFTPSVPETTTEVDVATFRGKGDAS